MPNHSSTLLVGETSIPRDRWKNAWSTQFPSWSPRRTSCILPCGFGTPQRIMESRNTRRLVRQVFPRKDVAITPGNETPLAKVAG